MVQIPCRSGEHPLSPSLCSWSRVSGASWCRNQVIKSLHFIAIKKIRYKRVKECFSFWFCCNELMMLCKGKSRQLSMTYSCQNPRPLGRADEQRQERQSSVCRQIEVFLMYSPSWPWQISVVPVVPSTNTAFLLISFRDGVRGGQCEHIVYSKPQTGFMTKHEISTSWCNKRRKEKKFWQKNHFKIWLKSF